MLSSIASASARLFACPHGSAPVRAWLCALAGVALRACWRGSESARVRVWFCVCARAALRAGWLGSVRVPAQLCSRAYTRALRPMHIVKGLLQHVPPADQFVCPPPLLVPLHLSFSLSSIPFSPSSFLYQVDGCCHILCPTWPLVLARSGRPSCSLCCLADIASGDRLAWPAGGRRQAGPALPLLGRPVTTCTWPSLPMASGWPVA